MIDLHMHSTFSDGSWTPVQLVEEAIRLDLRAIALTDHDTVDGFAPLLRAAKAWPSLKVIPALELDSDYEGGGMHFLGYGVQPQDKVLREHLDWLRGGAEARMQEMLSRLHRVGITLTRRDLLAVNPDSQFSRMDIAEAILRRGFARTRDEAFTRFLAQGKPGYAPKRKLSPFACIDLIQEAGGVAVLAHPFTVKMNPRDFREAVKNLKAHGLGGLEVYYSENNPAWEKTYGDLARMFDLIPTGGSDFHGSNTPDVRLGVGTGSLQVSDDLLPPLLKAIREAGGYLP
jgi:predicted metal-dependent phosphoesterase TrpH